MGRSDRIAVRARVRCLAVSALGGVAALTPVAACAQEKADAWPTRPVRLIVAFPPGGAADLVARTIGQRLTDRWGQQFVVDNRSGAGGIIGSELAAKATPDGYTFLFGSSSTVATQPAMQKDLPYDPVRDFAPVALTTLIPNIVVAHASVNVRNLRELIELARAKPGQLSYASNGTGTASHFAGELFRRAAGIQWIHVPYKGAGVAINDAVGGHVQFLIGAISTSLPHVRAGRLRAVAVTSIKRSAGIPEVPTIAEQGFPGFDVVQWFGVLAPARTPAPVVNKLNAAIVASNGSAEIADRFARQGLDAVTGSPAEFAAFIKGELARWSRTVKELGIKPDA
jgi:tripartite-type tricarboxylate transporter receptor subunit TctC